MKRKRRSRWQYLACLVLLFACHDASAAGVPLDRLNANNVVYDTPGADSRDSMPLGQDFRRVAPPHSERKAG